MTLSRPAPLPGIVVLTGAGISAESGISTFRDEGGLWAQHRIEDVATPEAFRRNPALVQGFYNARRAQLQSVQPNAAHQALAMLGQRWHAAGGAFLLVTQNVDDLHARAGSTDVLPMHGELRRARCLACGAASPWQEDITPTSPCPACHSAALRPHIVWFGEMPLQMERIEQALDGCGIFIAIGTSGNVYPAAGFVRGVAPGTRRVELNLEPTEGSFAFQERRYGPATAVVPAFAASLLEEYGLG